MSDKNTTPEYTSPTRKMGRDKNGNVTVFPADDPTPQTQGAPAALPAPSAPATPKPQKSPFRNHPNFVAGSIKIGDTTYDYGQLTDKLREWMEKRPQFVADKLGISLGAFERDQYAPDTPENRAAVTRLPEEARPEIEFANAEEVKKLPAYFEETYDRILDKCLVGCDYPGVDFERTPEMKYELAMEVKAALVAQISRSSKFGLSQNNFLR
ncbi:MAG: hypothetical protein KY445_11450 [Armatimonadetes bacterium]|nr:hypothetical protein [Armatimonadota bacterium]